MSPAPDLPPFVLLQDDVMGVRRLFAAPSEILEAWTAADLETAFAKAEAARRAGRWVAGYIAYEAGYLLEEKLNTLLPDGRKAPLLLMGIFDDAKIVSHRPRQRSDPPPPAPLINARAAWNRRDYATRFDSLKSHIALGDCRDSLPP